MKNRLLLLSLIVLPLLAGACAPMHAREVNEAQEERLALGKIQREVRVGLTSAEVLTLLGSPNIVTTDAQRREIWVYDRVSTETLHSGSGGSLFGLFLNPFNEDGIETGKVGYSSGVTARSQRTMTVVIKFDKSNKVRDFAYHTTRF